VNAFSITECYGSRTVCFVYTFGFVVEDYLVKLLSVDSNWDRLRIVFVENAVVQEPLLPVNRPTSVSALA
jgi:hypothetical protein